MTLPQEIAAERARQDGKWGVQNLPDVPCGVGGIAPGFSYSPASQLGIPDEVTAKARCDAAMADGSVSWGHIAVEELCEVVDAASYGDVEATRAELIQLAAVCHAWLEAIDRRAGVVPMEGVHGALEERVALALCGAPLEGLAAFARAEVQRVVCAVYGAPEWVPT